MIVLAVWCAVPPFAYGSGPRATPTVQDDRVYTLGTMGDLCCLETATGKDVWQKNLVAEYKTTIPGWYAGQKRGERCASPRAHLVGLARASPGDWEPGAGYAVCDR